MGTHWVKKPKTTGQSWMIFERSTEGKSRSIDQENLDALNKLWKEGNLDRRLAEEKVREIIKQLRKARERVSIFNSVNAKVLDSYWEKEYAHRILVDPQSMKNSLISAVNDLENLSLLVATRGEIQTKINQKYVDNPEKQRRVCSRLNQLLKFQGRDFKLRLAKVDEPEISYISESQLEQLMGYLPQYLRCFIGTLFYTGIRLGEAFAFEIKSEGRISVKKQIDKKKVERGVKNRKPRNVEVDMKGWHYIHEFYVLRGEEFGIFPRNRDYRKILKKAARKIFKNKRNHVTIHDLRHSFAIHMLNKGLSLTEIALLLGDSVAVANKYYLGFVATDETLDLIAQKLKA